MSYSSGNLAGFGYFLVCKNADPNNNEIIDLQYNPFSLEAKLIYKRESAAPVEIAITKVKGPYSTSTVQVKNMQEGSDRTITIEASMFEVFRVTRFFPIFLERA